MCCILRLSCCSNLYCSQCLCELSDFFTSAGGRSLPALPFPSTPLLPCDERINCVAQGTFFKPPPLLPPPTPSRPAALCVHLKSPCHWRLPPVCFSARLSAAAFSMDTPFTAHAGPSSWNNAPIIKTLDPEDLEQDRSPRHSREVVKPEYCLPERLPSTVSSNNNLIFQRPS